MRAVLSIYELEKDLKDISDRMCIMKNEERMEKEEKEAGLRGWKMDIGLGALSLLTVFSAFVDSTAMIKMWKISGENAVGLLVQYGVVYIIITLVGITALKILITSYIQYKREIKKKLKG